MPKLHEQARVQYIHKIIYKQEFVDSCQQLQTNKWHSKLSCYYTHHYNNSISWFCETAKPVLLTYGAETTQPRHLFSGLPAYVSPALESLSNINAGPKALA